jgi:hypothetical protein
VRPDPHPSSRASEQSARDLGSSRVTSETGTLRVPHAATPGRSDTTFGTGLSGKSVRAICAIAPLPVAGQAAKTSCAEKQSLRAHSRTSPLRRCSSKIFLFRFCRNCDLVGASRFDLRGVRVVTDVERGTRWPQVSRWTSERVWTAKSCGPGIPVLMPRSRALTSAWRRGQESRSPRRACISRNPSRREGRNIRLILWFLPRAFFTHGGHGYQQIPGLPCALSLSRATLSQNPGACIRRGEVDPCVHPTRCPPRFNRT